MWTHWWWFYPSEKFPVQSVWWWNTGTHSSFDTVGWTKLCICLSARSHNFERNVKECTRSRLSLLLRTLHNPKNLCMRACMMFFLNDVNHLALTLSDMGKEQERRVGRDGGGSICGRQGKSLLLKSASSDALAESTTLKLWISSFWVTFGKEIGHVEGSLPICWKIAKKNGQKLSINSDFHSRLKMNVPNLNSNKWKNNFKSVTGRELFFHCSRWQEETQIRHCASARESSKFKQKTWRKGWMWKTKD